MLRGQMPKVNTGLTSEQTVKPLNTSIPYRCTCLVSTTFVIFEILFLILYANDFWFSFDVSGWGIIAVCICAVAAHFLLSFIESPIGCLLVKPIRHGLPLIFYRRWLIVEPKNMCVGLRKMLWGSASKLRLTIFGNLQIWSNQLSGPGQYDLVLSFPFNCAPLSNKQKFIDAAYQGNSELATNKRLERQLKKREVPGMRIAQTATTIIMVALVLDLGRSSFAFVETLKDFYLAQTKQMQGNNLLAASYLAAGDAILNGQTFPSLIGSKFFNSGPIAARVHNARSDALWQVGRKQEALREAELASNLCPHDFRFNLHLARILEELGQGDRAQEQLTLAVKNRDDLLLPRLYLLAWLHVHKTTPATHSYCQVTLSNLKDKVFGDEPYWPPGGNRFLPETIYQDDLHFVLDRLF
jgi:hypothetical protein